MSTASSDDLGDRLQQCYSGAVYDVLRAIGLPDQLLPTTIRPLDPGKTLAGKVFTVSGHLDLTLDPHATLLAWTTLLSKAPRDSVVVCQPNDSTLAHMGELSSETLALRYVLADRDGIALIPGAVAAEVTEKVEQVLSTENKVRTAILQGMDPVDA